MMYIQTRKGRVTGVSEVKNGDVQIKRVEWFMAKRVSGKESKPWVR